MTARSGLFVAPVPGATPVGMAPTDGRLALAGLLGVTPRLVSGGAVTQSNSNMQFTLAQSVFQLPDTSNAAATFLSPVDPTVLTPAAGPSSGSRVDSMIVKQNNVENADADSRANAIILPGTAGAPGLPATLPPGYFRYANINVPTNATLASACTVTILSPTVLSPLPINAATYALLSTVTGAAGQQATVTADPTSTNNGVYAWSGSLWLPVAGPCVPHTLYLKTSTFPWPSTPSIHTWDATPVEGTVAGFTVTGGAQRFTITTPGFWRFAGALGIPGVSGYANIEIRKNGTADRRYNNAASSAAVASAQFAYERQLAVGDYVEFYTTGSNLTGAYNDAGVQLAFLNIDYLHA